MIPGSNMVPGLAGLNALLWAIQALLAVQYLFHGRLFISPPAGMAQAIGAMGLHPAFRQFIGLAEIAAAIGLVLPGLARVLPGSTPLALLGLTIVMAGATIFHAARGEVPSAISTANLLLLVGLAAYLRWRVAPLRSRAERQPEPPSSR